jgi:hypothetical protein
MDGITRRLRVPAVRVMSHSSVPEELQRPLFNPIRIELIGIGRILSDQLSRESSLIYRITPEQFEEFLCDRLFTMGFEPRRVGAVNQKDGGVDILFWPRLYGAFPFLGAAQVKHHRDPKTKEGPAVVREFAGVIASHPLNVGMLVTNTSFSPDAKWFAREQAKLVRLRDFTDIQHWLANNFGDEAEWREIPAEIELCPGVVIKVR